MKTFTSVGEFVIEECYKCHIPFALTKEFQRKKSNDGTSFWCPAGHSQAYIGDENSKLQKELSREREKVKRKLLELDRAQGLYNAERNSHRATRGHVTRIKNRISAGVCPCCNRTFQNLKRHMDGKHPDFTNKQP